MYDSTTPAPVFFSFLLAAKPSDDFKISAKARSKSPPASSKTFLQSIMDAPVACLKRFTKSLDMVIPVFLFVFPLVCPQGPLHRPLRACSISAKSRTKNCRWPEWRILYFVGRSPRLKSRPREYFFCGLRTKPFFLLPGPQ